MADGRGGARKGAGRKKGVCTKATQDLREMINASLEKAGGIDYLHEQSKENPKAYMTLISKVIPRELNHTIEGSFTINVDKTDKDL